MSCSTTTTVRSRLISFSSSAVWRVSASVMPAAGSSTSRSFGSCASSMPISSHCFWPCERPPASRLRTGARWTMSRMPSMRAPASPFSLERQQDIVLDRVAVEHGRLLELAADAELGDLGLVEAGEIVAAVEQEVALVGTGPACDHVHHGGLAGAVG